MAGSSTWFGWLDGLVTAVFVPAAPAPGSHEARLELLRVGALLDKEACKPAGQRDDELLYRLKVEYRKRQLATSQVSWQQAAGGRGCVGRLGGSASSVPSVASTGCAALAVRCPAHTVPLRAASRVPTYVPALQYQATIFNQNAYVYNLPTYHQCCAAQCWVRQRAAASYRALHDYFSQHIQQVGQHRW